MGVVGINRWDFLYEIKFWEAICLARGYERRQRVGWEQARLVAYHAAFAFGCKDEPPTISEWIPFPWEKEREEEEKPTVEYIQEMRQKLQDANKKIGKQ